MEPANADPAWVVQANVGRGVEIYFWGLAPEKRLPLRAYLAGFTVKNGVPINYVECISLFDWTEIGFNTFPRVSRRRNRMDLRPDFAACCANCMV